MQHIVSRIYTTLSPSGAVCRQGSEPNTSNVWGLKIESLQHIQVDHIL